MNYGEIVALLKSELERILGGRNRMIYKGYVIERDSDNVWVSIRMATDSEAKLEDSFDELIDYYERVEE